MVALWFCAAGVVWAQTKTVWDGAYTDAQADRGSVAFARSCGGCHTLGAQGRSPLAGDVFWKSFSQKTAGALLEFVSLNMPNGAPASLSEGVYADIVAAMLKANGLPSGANELGAKTVAGVQIVPKDGNSELPANALVRVVGCLTRSGAEWVVERATTPERAERTRAAGEDAVRPLGSRTMTLKFVLTRLDTWAGSRVLVAGLLMGAGGSDGINVTNVSRVAEKCP